jgi:multiple sugar transport system substrate-binding protein
MATAVTTTAGVPSPATEAMGAAERGSSRRLTRRALHAGSAMGALALLAACGTSGDQASGGASQTISKDATVRYMTNSDPQSLAGTQEIVGLFAKVQPKVKLELEPMGFNDIPGKLTAAAAAGTPSDCAQCSYPGMVGLAAKGALAALEPYTKKDSAFDFADIFPGYVEASKYKGTLYAISIEGGPFVAFFNKNLFESSGVKLPEAKPDGWGDWNAFLEGAKKMTRAGAAAAPAAPGGAQTNAPTEGAQFATIQGDYWNWIYTAGGEIINKELTKCMLDRPEAIEGLQMWSDLAKVHRVAPSPAELQGQNVNDWFRSGRLATIPTGRFFALQQLNTATNLRWDVTPLPKKKASMYHFNANNVLMMKGGKELDAAWAWLSYLEGKEMVKKQVATGRFVPGRKSAAESQEYLNSVMPPAGNKLFTDLVAKGQVRTLPGTPVWNDVAAAIAEGLPAVQRGDRSASDWAREITPRIDQLLKTAP